MVEVNNDISKPLTKRLKKSRFNIKSVRGSKDETNLLMITAKRKKTDDVINIIRSFDKDAEIMTEKIKVINPHL